VKAARFRCSTLTKCAINPDLIKSRIEESELAMKARFVLVAIQPPSGQFKKTGPAGGTRTSPTRTSTTITGSRMRQPAI
jgi:hypothetical protein